MLRRWALPVLIAILMGTGGDASHTLGATPGVKATTTLGPHWVADGSEPVAQTADAALQRVAGQPTPVWPPAPASGSPPAFDPAASGQPNLAVIGPTAYVARGNLLQYRLTDAGPELRRSVPISGTAAALSAVIDDPAAGAAGVGRLGVASGMTLNLFRVTGSESPQPLGIHTFPEPDPLDSSLDVLESTPDMAFVAHKALGLRKVFATTLEWPLKLQEIAGGSGHGPVHTEWQPSGDGWLALYHVVPIGGFTRYSLGRFDLSGTESATRSFDGVAGNLLTARGLAYVTEAAHPPATGPGRILVIDPSTEDLAILAETDPAPMSAAAGVYAFGLDGEELVVTSLADPLSPTPKHRHDLAGHGTELRMSTAGVVVMSRVSDGWVLEHFVIESDGAPSRLGEPASVPGPIGVVRGRAYFPRAHSR